MSTKKLPFYPWYDISKFLYYFIWIFFIIYVIGTGVFFLFVQNNSVVYDWFSSPGNPGASLSSRRGSFLDVAVRLIIIIHIIFCGLIASMILYRKNFGCNILWVILIAISILIVALGLLALAREYVNCNKQNEYGNLCNDPNWCNVNEIRMNLENRCPDPNPSPSPALLSSLSPKPDFLGLFWTNFILLLMQIAYLVLIIYYWSLERDYEIITKVGNDDDKKQIKEYEKLLEDEKAKKEETNEDVQTQIPLIEEYEENTVRRRRERITSPPRHIEVKLGSTVISHGLKKKK